MLRLVIVGVIGGAQLTGVGFNVQVVGAGTAGYNRDGRLPPSLDLGSDFTPVLSEQTVIGNLCFEIASNDAASLLLQGRGTAGLSPGSRSTNSA